MEDRSLVAQAHELANQARYHEAEALLTQRLGEDPKDKTALDLLGFVLFFQGRYAEAEAACRRALEIVPDEPYATKGLGLCVAKQGRVDEGLAHIVRATALRPAWFDAYWDWIVVLRDASRIDEARRVLARALIALPMKARDFEPLRRALEGAPPG